MSITDKSSVAVGQPGLAVDVGSAWRESSTAPTDCERVLAAYLGVYGPALGFIANKRFYPDGGSGSEPMTHWMPIPSLPNTKTCHGPEAKP